MNDVIEIMLGNATGYASGCAAEVGAVCVSELLQWGEVEVGDGGAGRGRCCMRELRAAVLF
jgi:hypothetical protein